MNLICGINPVLEALSAGTRHFDRLLVVKGLRSRRLSEAIRRATRLGIPLRFEMRETLDRMAGGVPHQGLIAVVSAKPTLSLENLFETARDPALLVALDGVEDPRNLGAILRSAEAAGADGALLPERRSAGLSETVGRASAGALEHIKVARVGNLVQALEGLKARGVWVVGFDAAGRERWDSVDLNRPVCLVLGGEGRGIRRLVRDRCDHLVSIPHFGHVNSLNVSVAAGIALYEVVRQRGAVPSPVRPIPARPIEAPMVLGPHPDDEESDPGAAPESSLLPPETPGPAADDAPPEAEPASLPNVDIHGDEVAWGKGPTVLKPISFRRGRRPPARRPKTGSRRPVAETASRSREGSDQKSSSKNANPGEAPPGRKGRRRRRRKRPAGTNQGAAAAEPATPPSDSSSPSRASKAGEKDGKDATPSRGRRRGRRRRR